MKSFAVIAILIAGAFAQRASIVSPTPMSQVRAGSSFVASIRQDQTLSALSQVSLTIAVTACYDVCADPSQWGDGTVLYNGAFNPQYNNSHPQYGLYQNFSLTLPQGWPLGENVLQISHLSKIGASQIFAFDYSDIHFNVTGSS